MAWQQITIESPTGSSLNGYFCEPSDTPKAVVQINHGMAEHAARYEEFARALCYAGYATIAHDHRGHGFTKAHDAAQGFFSKDDGAKKVLRDVDAINDHLHGRFPDVPIVCFGHSMGSIIALNYAMRKTEKIAALAAWNFGVETGVLMVVFRTLLKLEQFLKGSDVPSSIAPKLTFDAWNKEFSPTRTDFDWLSRDVAEVDKYVGDPLCGFPVTVGMWLDVTDMITFAASDANLSALPKTLPVHLLGGECDPCSLHGKTVENIARRIETLAMSDVTCSLLSDTRHESLNELNKEETTNSFVRWLDERFASSAE